MQMITTKRELTEPSGVLKDGKLISGNKDLKNSFDEATLSRDYLITPKPKKAERRAKIRILLMPL